MQIRKLKSGMQWIRRGNNVHVYSPDGILLLRISRDEFRAIETGLMNDEQSMRLANRNP